MSNWKGRDILSIQDLSKEDILHVLEIAKRLKHTPEPSLLAGKLLGTLFFEPSTRTRLSFESAMCRLGGNAIGFSDAKNTSTKKGETLEDTIRMVSGYVDVIAMRHPEAGSAIRAASVATVPVINGGDGPNQHPTQTILDLFTIQECQGRLDGLSVAFVGDLKFGRTVHSLSHALSHFDVKQYFVSPDILHMPEEDLTHLSNTRITFSVHERMEEILERVDILYMTRVQGERFENQEEYEKLKDVYILDAPMLERVKPNMKIMHPLPRVNEITTAVDKTPHAYYFEQAQNAVFARQALLALVLGMIE